MQPDREKGLSCRHEMQHEFEKNKKINSLGKKCQPYPLILKRFIGTFHETAKVVNSLFGETWRIAEFGSTNCQLEFERCRFI